MALRSKLEHARFWCTIWAHVGLSTVIGGLARDLEVLDIPASKQPGRARPTAEKGLTIVVCRSKKQVEDLDEWRRGVSFGPLISQPELCEVTDHPALPAQLGKNSRMSGLRIDGEVTQ